MKNFNLYICGIFIFFMIFIFSCNFAPDKAFSETENRNLAQKPEFSIQNLISGKFSKDFEQYIQDQFAAREFWVTLKTETEVLLGKNENNDTYLGKDNWYFEKKEITNTEVLEKNTSVINQFAQWAKENNIKSNFLPVYSSYTLYKEFLPSNAFVFDEVSAFEYIKSNISKDVNIIDIYNSLLSHKEEYIYFKTDHHWTQLGAFYAYRQLESLGFMPYSLEDFEIKEGTEDFFGSLYSKAPLWRANADRVDIFELNKNLRPKYSVEYFDKASYDDDLYVWENLDKKDKYTVFLDGNHSIITIKTDIDNNKKLLVAKDSFAHALIPFLANHYSEIHVMDLRYYSPSVKKYILQNNITDTLFIYNISWFSQDSNLIKLKY